MSIANMLTNLAEKLSNMLSGINTKLTAKGVSEAATLNDVAARIDEIPTGTDTTLDASVAALASDIVSPKKAWVNGNLVAGTMADMGTQTATLNTSTTSYTIPAGKHSGSGKVSIVTQTKSATPSSSAQTIVPDNGKVLSSVSVAAIPTGTLSAPNISVSAGGVITATSGVSTAGYMSASASKSGTYAMLTQAGKTVWPSTEYQIAVPSERYTTDTVYVAGDSNLVSENIKSGVSIFGVDGTLSGGGASLMELVDVSSDYQTEIMFMSDLFSSLPTKICVARLSGTIHTDGLAGGYWTKQENSNLFSYKVIVGDSTVYKDSNVTKVSVIGNILQISMPTNVYAEKGSYVLACCWD